MQPIVVIYLLWVMWFLTWLAAAMGTYRPPRKLSRLQNFLYRLATTGATFLLFTITPWPGLDVQYRLWDRALDESWSWLLVAVAFTGFCLAWWSTVHRIAVLRRHSEVVDNGPYKVVRHPIYVGLIIAAFATAVMFGRPSSLLGAVLLTVAFVVKILIEEQVLREETYAYDDYIARVPMLVPFFPTRGRPVGQGSPSRSEPVAPFQASSAEEADKKDLIREITAMPVSEPATEPASVVEPAKSAVTAGIKLGSDLGLSPAPAKAVQLSLLLEDAENADQHVMSDAGPKDLPANGL